MNDKISSIDRSRNDMITKKPLKLALHDKMATCRLFSGQLYKKYELWERVCFLHLISDFAANNVKQRTSFKYFPKQKLNLQESQLFDRISTPPGFN